jgi:glycosyltransferase involved in cell wall biosynthesis
LVSRELAFVVPGDLATPTGGYAYDRRIVAELRRLGWSVDVVDIGDEFPRPSARAREAAAARLAALPAGRPIVVDGLAFGVLPDLAAQLRKRHRLIALVHHPLACESGLDGAEVEAFRISEQHALAMAHHVIVTSAPTARLLQESYAVARAAITVVPPGSDPVLVMPSRNADRVALLAVGAVVTRKGYDVLIAALAKLKHLSWHLTVIGDRTRDNAAVARLDADLERFGLSDRITVAGAVSDAELGRAYRMADVFVLASRFEGYGMAYADAIAHGLPVIGTTGGAIPATVPAGAAILVPPDDIDAFAAALHRFIADPAERAQRAAAACAAAQALPSWGASARLFARAVEGKP